MNTYIISSFMAVAGGLAIFSYEKYAENKGWPIGKLYVNFPMWTYSFSFLAILGGSIEFFYLVTWYNAILLVFSACLGGALLTFLFKKQVQWIGILVLIASILIYMAGGAEVVKT